MIAERRAVRYPACRRHFNRYKKFRKRNIYIYICFYICECIRVKHIYGDSNTFLFLIRFQPPCHNREIALKLLPATTFLITVSSICLSNYRSCVNDLCWVSYTVQIEIIPFQTQIISFMKIWQCTRLEWTMESTFILLAKQGFSKACWI